MMFTAINQHEIPTSDKLSHYHGNNTVNAIGICNQSLLRKQQITRNPRASPRSIERQSPGRTTWKHALFLSAWGSAPEPAVAPRCLATADLRSGYLFSCWFLLRGISPDSQTCFRTKLPPGKRVSVTFHTLPCLLGSGVRICSKHCGRHLHLPGGGFSSPPSAGWVGVQRLNENAELDFHSGQRGKLSSEENVAHRSRAPTRLTSRGPFWPEITHDNPILEGRKRLPSGFQSIAQGLFCQLRFFIVTLSSSN